LLGSLAVGVTVSLADIEAQALAALAPGIGEFVRGGAGDELTLAANLEGWRALALRPRRLVDVSEPSTEATVLGRRLQTPLFVAPTAMNALVHPGAERAVARAAARAGAAYCRSGAASQTHAEVAQAGGVLWSQLYVLRDRGLTRNHVAAAAEAGYHALVLTVDAPVLGLRDHDRRSGLLQSATPQSADSGMATGALATQLDPSLTWADLEALAGESPLPVVVKGIGRGDDARRAIDAGARAIMVSNHGGRQLDGERSTAAALPEVVEAVGDRADVLVDGGVRRGADVVKALALGARAVGVGRLPIWGLAVGGEDGAFAVLDRLAHELRVTLALCGTPDAAAVPRDLLA
jgi:4-hydroxymandelate oxidase